MASFLCFICHITINTDTNEDIREKFKDVVGMNLCPDSHLCHICCHVLNKLWLFKCICLKRSLEYPVLFSERGTINLQKDDTQVHILCPDEMCDIHQYRNISHKSYYVKHNYEGSCESQSQIDLENKYVELQDDTVFDDYLKQSHVKSEVNSNYEDSNLDSGENNQFTVSTIELDNKGDEYSNHYSNNYTQNNITHVAEIKEYQQFNYENQQNSSLLNSNVKQEYNDSLCTFYNKSLEKDVDSIKELENKKDLEVPNKKSKNKNNKKNKRSTFKKIILTLEEQKAELEARRKQKKYVEAEFKCYNCALGFLFKDTYQAHMMRHEESNGEYRCDICTLRFAFPVILRAHTSMHCERYRCTRCGLMLRSRAREHHARQCGQDLCPGEGAACHLCAAMFKDLSGLRQHLKRFHESKTSNRTYGCTICGKNYKNQAAVRSHMIRHINRKFSCDQCPATFTSPYTLNQHKKRHSADVDREQHYCDTCNIGYRTRKSLLAHRRNTLAHQLTVYECPVCGRACPNERAMRAHAQAVHSGVKPYTCAVCPAAYSTRKSLVRHTHTHTHGAASTSAGRPGATALLFVCHLCGHGFKDNGKLKRHLREVCEKFKGEQLNAVYEQDLL